MNLQERVTAWVFAENSRVLFTLRFFALWVGDTIELSTVMERYLSGLAFLGVCGSL
jgi:hypothetical protein